MAMIFVSYSHEDREYLDRILGKLRNSELDLFWIDKQEIKPGSDWKKEIEKGLREAKAALILAGDNYFNSEFIRQEEYPFLVKRAEQGNLIIFWIPVNYREYSNGLDRYQGLLDPKTPLISFKERPELDRTIHEICLKLKDRVQHISQPSPEESSNEESNPGYVKIVGLRTGLALLMDTISQQLEVREEVVLLRILPFEITPAMLQVARHKPETMTVVNDYLGFVEEVILGGESGNSFWDKSIYGHLKTDQDSRAQIFNEATWEFIARTFFATPPPDTTLLAVNPELENEWIFIVGTSPNQDEEPQNFICTLKLRPEGDFLFRPRRGEFITDPKLVQESYRQFNTMLRNLQEKKLSWLILERNPKQVSEIQEEVQDFILYGRLP